MNQYVWTCICLKELRIQADTKEQAQKDAARKGWTFSPLASCSTRCVAERFRRKANSLGQTAKLSEVVEEADKLGLELHVALAPKG